MPIYFECLTLTKIPFCVALCIVSMPFSLLGNLEKKHCEKYQFVTNMRVTVLARQLLFGWLDVYTHVFVEITATNYAFIDSFFIIFLIGKHVCYKKDLSMM